MPPLSTTQQHLLDLDNIVCKLRNEMDLLLGWAVTRFGDENTFPVALKNLQAEIDEHLEPSCSYSAQVEEEERQAIIKQEIEIYPVDVDSHSIGSPLSFSDDDDEDRGEIDESGTGSLIKPSIVKVVKLSDNNNLEDRILESKRRYLKSLPSQYKPGPKSAKLLRSRPHPRRHNKPGPKSSKVAPKAEENTFEQTVNLELDHDVESNTSSSTRRKSSATFPCKICGKEFSENGGLKRHLLTHNTEKSIHTCDICGKEYGRSDTLVRHKKDHTGENLFKCDICGRVLKRQDYFRDHRLKHLYGKS